MKKILSIALALAIVMGLCACGSSGEGNSGEDNSQLMVGYNRQEIMPDGNVPLGGYGQTQTRISTNFIDYLYATCLAFQQGGETVLIFAVDLINAHPWVKTARELISQETGVPFERILVSFSHTHSGPDMASSDPSINDYKRIVNRQMVKAAKLAIEDMAVSTLYGVKTQTDGLNFVREYILEDGRKGAGATFIASGTPVAHMEDNDPEMLLIKADREGEKKDILMMNWQVHPVVTGGMKKYNISADIVASVRDEMEMATGMNFIYFTGAAGNHNPTSEIASEVNKASGKQSATKEQMGKALADTALAALPDLQPIEGNGVQANHLMYEYPYNHEDEDKAAEARQAVAIWETDGHAAADKFAVENGFHTIYHASAVLSRSSRPPTGTMELDTVRVGGVGFAFSPSEMYSSTGRYIKNNSPYAFTLVLSCSNESHGYYATMESYDAGTYGSTTSKFARGCAEASSQKLVEMLQEIQ